MIRRAACLAMTLAAAACESGPFTSGATPKIVEEAHADVQGEVGGGGRRSGGVRLDRDARDRANALTIGAIAESGLPRGGCGFILWTLEGERPTPAMRYVSGEAGEISLNGRLEELALVDVDGPRAFGVGEVQRFAIDDPEDDDAPPVGFVTTSFRFGLGFEGGAYLEDGLITVETSEGWRSVAPAAGLAGCRG